MNWDAIGALAELLGAIGVIASLIYLATQIRQSREQMERNERTTRAAVYQQFWGYLNETSSRPASSPDHAEAIRLGLEDFDQLSDNDAYRFDTWALGMVHALENAHYQHRVDMLDADRWSKHHADLRGLAQRPGFVQWWNSSSANLSPEFVALVEEILGEESEGADRAQS